MYRMLASSTGVPGTAGIGVGVLAGWAMAPAAKSTSRARARIRIMCAIIAHVVAVDGPKSRMWKWRHGALFVRFRRPRVGEDRVEKATLYPDHHRTVVHFSCSFADRAVMGD